MSSLQWHNDGIVEIARNALLSIYLSVHLTGEGAGRMYSMSRSDHLCFRWLTDILYFPNKQHYQPDRRNEYKVWINMRSEPKVASFGLFCSDSLTLRTEQRFYSTVQLWPHQCRLHFFTRNVLLNSPQSTISSLCYMPRTKYVTDRVNKINRSLYLYWVLSYWGMFHQCSGKLGKPVIGCLVFGFWFLMTGCLGSKISWSSRDFLCDVSSFFISQKNWTLIWFTILKKTLYWMFCSYMKQNITDDTQLCTRNSFQIDKSKSILMSSQLIQYPTELGKLILLGTWTSSPLLHFQGCKMKQD